MKIQTPYGKTKIYSAKNHSPEAERMVVIPGYSETTTHNKELVNALATQGFDVSTFNQPRRGGKTKDPIQRQGRAVLHLIEATVPENEKVHAVAHSLGSAAVLRAAEEAPERFASIILMQPLGMVGEQSLPELGVRVSKKVVKNQAGALRGQSPDQKPTDGSYAARVDTESALGFSTRVAKAQLAGGSTIVAQPPLAFKEASASSKYKLAGDVAKVTELDIPVHVVNAPSDELFDNDKAHAGYEAGLEATSYSAVADRDARHDTFWMQPERTARIVGQLIHKT